MSAFAAVSICFPFASWNSSALVSFGLSWFLTGVDAGSALCLVSWLWLSRASSSILPVDEAVSTASLVFRKPNIGPKLPLFSTVTKLVRTFEIGRELLLRTLSEPAAGDRPLDGGDVCSFLASNIASMLRTPPLPLAERSAIASSNLNLLYLYALRSSQQKVAIV